MHARRQVFDGRLAEMMEEALFRIGVANVRASN